MTHYAILHKPTGQLFPSIKGGRRRGSTYIELPFTGAPRIFTTLPAAKNCLRWWSNKDNRQDKAQDMQIVEVELRIVGQQELAL